MSIDIILFSVFLGLNLILGVLAGRRVKTLREFSIGFKKFSTATVTSTIVATWISGGFMFYALQNIYTNGLQFIIVTMAGSLCLLFMGQVLAVRVGEFLRNLSVAEAMGDLYGKNIRIITAITGIIKTTGQLAIQFKVIAKMLTLLLGFEGPWVTAMAASIVIVYSAFGGIRSVTITDVFQFITFCVFIPIIALVIWHNLKDPGKIGYILNASPLFSWKQAIGWNKKTLSMLGLLLFFALPSMTPPVFQRIVMSKDTNQVRASFSYAAGIRLLIVLGVAWIAILLLADSSVQDPKNLVNHIINHYAYPGLKGLIAIGIVSMAMSTADSNLNAATVLVINDIIKPIKKNWQESMLVIRLASIGLGIIGLLLALSMQNILDLLLSSASFYMPIVTVPFLLAIFGFRSKPRSVLIGMAAGFTTVILWSFFFTNADSIIPGMLANLVFLMGSHYALKEEGGWVGIKDPYPLLAARQVRQNAWKHFIYTLKQTPIYDYLQSNLPIRESTYPLMGIYILISTYLSFYFFKDHLITQYPRLQYIIFHSVLLIIAMLITYPIWNETFKSKKLFITIGWYLSILYVFFFLAALLTLVSGLQQEFIFLFVGNLIIASILVPFPLFLTMFILALPISWITFKSITSITTLPTGFNFWQFKLIYTWIVLGTSISVIFNIRKNYARVKVKFRQTYLEKLEAELSTRALIALQEKNEEYETDVNTKTKNYLDKIEKAVAELKQNLEQVYKLELNTSSNEQIAYEQLCSMIDKLNHTIYDISDKLSLSLTKLSPLELVDESIVAYRTTKENHDADAKIMLQCFTTFRKTECDVEKIKLLLSNTLARAALHNPTKKPIILRLENTMIVYRIHHPFVRVMREQAIKVTISTFERPVQECDYYIARPNKEVASTVRGASEPMLLQNLRILDSHYGYMGLELVAPTDYQQFYVLPIKVNRLTRSRLLKNHWISF
jgi:Na+/proline symporter